MLIGRGLSWLNGLSLTTMHYASPIVVGES